MLRLKLADVLAWTGGQVIGGPADDPDREFAGLCTDTRTIRPGCLFLALHGQVHDGHQYLAQALNAGACGLLIDDRTALAADSQSCPVILAGDTLQALQDLAAGYRRTLPGKIIGISGSVGKTSTRQMVSACLQPIMPVHQTAANLNNEIGLPQTLLQAEPGHRAVILEMGMRGPGEISLLSRIARPDIAILTCIGYSHIGRLGSQAAILAAKAEIMNGLQPDGLLILNADDPLLLGLGRTQTGRRLAYVTTQPDLASSLVADGACFCLLADQIRAAALRTDFRASLITNRAEPDRVPVSLPFPGTHHVLNTLFGLAVARELQADLHLAAAGAAAGQTAGNRQRILEASGILMMDDSYNASPESMLAALQTLSGLAGSRRKIAALGGMLELGDFAAAAHHEVGRQTAIHGIEFLLVTGPQSADLAAGARAVRPDLRIEEYPDNLTLAEALIPQLRAGDCLLIKGSRGFAMEKVTAAIIAFLEGKASDLSKEGTAR